MTIHTEFRFHPQITQIGCYWGDGGHTELYLIEGERLAIVDTGCIDIPEQYIAPALEAMGRSLKDIGVIINTHGHFDHAGGNAQLVAASGAPVWMGEGDAEVAENLDRQFDLYFAQTDTLVNRRDRLEASRQSFLSQTLPTRVDRTLKGDEVLDLGRGVELDVMYSPGHTPGSICLYWEREGLLFSGDSITGAGSRPGGLPLIYYPQDYERTLDHLLHLDINVLCLGHHYRSLSLTRESMKYGRTGKDFVAQSREIAHLIGDAVGEAVRSAPDAPFLAMAASALPRIGERLPLKLDPETGLPVAWGTPALYSNWQRYRANEGAELARQL